MIVFVFPGVDKSSIADRNDIVSLDGSNYSKDTNDWYLTYCKDAEALSDQGKIVLLTPYEQVLDYFVREDIYNLYTVYPHLSILDEWLNKFDYTQFLGEMEPNQTNINAIKEILKSDFTKKIQLLNYYDKNDVFTDMRILPSTEHFLERIIEIFEERERYYEALEND